MKLQVPVRTRRCKCQCYGNKCSYVFAAALDATGVFEVEDCIESVVFTACDAGDAPVGQWLWADEEWSSLDDPKAATRLKSIIKRSESKPPRKTVQGIDSAVWADAEAYTKEYDKRYSVVKKSFRSVTK